jgi:acyl carrier protein
MMSDTELRASVLAVLQAIAPDVDGATLRDNRPLRLQVYLDSTDWLNFLTGLGTRFKVVIREADHGQLVTLQDVMAYLKARLARSR